MVYITLIDFHLLETATSVEMHSENFLHSESNFQDVRDVQCTFFTPELRQAFLRKSFVMKKQKRKETNQNLILTYINYKDHLHSSFYTFDFAEKTISDCSAKKTQKTFHIK